MDADYEMKPQPQEKSKRKKSAFAKAIFSTKPKFDPNEKTFEEYFDEYYKLDYEDIVGDLPCRFRYRQVEPNDFGLSVEEILHCDDKELNQWASVKKAIQYRTKEEEKRDQKRYCKKGKDLKKKMMILKSLSNDNNEEIEGSGKDTEMLLDSGNEASHNTNKTNVTEQRLEAVAKKMKGNSKWRRKGKLPKKDRLELNQKRRLMRYFRGAKAEKVAELSSSRLRSYGVDKKRKKTK